MNIFTLDYAEIWRKIKLVIFFLIGTLGPLASVMSFLWIYFHSKVDCQDKYIAVSGGLVVSLVLFLAQQQIVHHRAPETRDVKAAANQILSSGITTIDFTIREERGPDHPYISKQLALMHFSRDRLSPLEMQNIAMRACAILENKRNVYDLVTVVSDYSLLHPLRIPLYRSTYTGTFPCAEWNTEQTLKQLEDIKRIKHGLFIF